MERIGIRGARLAGAIALVIAAVVGVSPSHTSAATTEDALVRRARAELRVFTDWLARSGARGYIGEVGWPDDRGGDGDEWNAVAEAWYRDADSAGLAVTAWSAGEWWGDYALATYEAARSWTGVSRPSTQATVVEDHPGTATAWRGVNVAGGEFGAPSVAATSTFSNRNPGTYDTAYHYDAQATFDYLASKGVKVVRIPFRWERIQPALGQPLDAAELQRLRGVVRRAGAAGLQVVLDLHNYGGYYHDVAGTGVRYALGTTKTTRAAFAELWGRLSRNFQNDPAVLGYGLMNEPALLPSVNGLAPAKVWERASQEAVSRIRANLDRKLVFVAGYEWSGVQRWSTIHPAPWITDGLGRTIYEAHHYWDRDSSGSYAHTYADEVADAARRGF